MIVGVDIFGLNDFHLKLTGLAQVGSSLLLARCGELRLNLLQGSVEVEDGLLEFDLSDQQLVLGIDVVVNELLQLNLAGHISVTLAEQFVDDLHAVVLVDAFLC